MTTLKGQTIFIGCESTKKKRLKMSKYMPIILLLTTVAQAQVTPDDGPYIYPMTMEQVADKFDGIESLTAKWQRFDITSDRNTVVHLNRIADSLEIIAANMKPTVEEPPPASNGDASIDFNTATVSELREVIRIRGDDAETIVMLRERDGPYTSVSDVKKRFIADRDSN